MSKDKDYDKSDELESQAPLATTHYEGCWDSGPKHYECALLEVKRLRGVESLLREKNGG